MSGHNHNQADERPIAERPPKVGKFAEDDRGNTFLVLSIRGDRATVEHVNTKQTYIAPLRELTRCVMIEEVSS